MNRLGVLILQVCLVAALLVAGNPRAEAVPYDYHTVSKGSRGADVRAVQFLLKNRGYLPITTDGIFGSDTDAKVRAFQDEEGLSVDGVVGPATWGALVVTVSAGATGLVKSFV